MSGVTRDGTAEPASRETKFSGANGDREIYFSCSTDHEQDWQLYLVDPYSAENADRTCIQYNGVSLPDIIFILLLPIYWGTQPD